MKNIKKYWREILLCIFVLFSLNKCTVACNRDTTINKQNIEISQKDSIIKVQTDSLNILKIRWNDAQSSQSTYQGIALGNQQELINQINELKIEKDNVQNKLDILTTENYKLKKENKQLKGKLQ